MGVMVEVTAKPSRLFALTSFHKLDDLLLSFPVEFLQEAKGADAPVPSWKLQMLVGVEADGLSILGLIQVLQVLQVQVENEVWNVIVRFLLRFLCC